MLVSAIVPGLLAAAPVAPTMFGGSAVPPGYHAFAAVNDTRSHGQVGDGLLSLNEVIRLHNSTLTLNQLSTAEQAQIQLIPGTDPFPYLSWARFDGSFTPVITIEQDLDIIVNTNYGLYMSSDNDKTVLDFSGANLTRGMLATTNSLQMRDFVFHGGQYGIDVVQTDIAGQIGFAINDCRFEGQTQFGVRIRSTTANGYGKGYLESCEFDGMATGMIWDAAANGRTSFFDLVNCRFVNVVNGVVTHPQDGGLGRYNLDRVQIEASMQGYELTHGGTTHDVQLRWRHVEIRAPGGATIDATAAGTTVASIQMTHVRAPGVGATALKLGDVGDDVTGIFEDSTFEGGLAVGTGGGTSPLVVQNLRCVGSQASFGTSPGQPLSVFDSRFENGVTTNSGTAAITFGDCSFAGGLLNGTATGPIVCLDSYVAFGTANSFVTETTPRPADQLGSMTVLPDDPTINSTVTLQADLPTGLFGAFLLGFTAVTPTLFPQPLHVYSQTGNTFLLPGAYRNQQQYLWPIPNSILFVGLDMIATLAVLPDPGTSALPVQIAPGKRFVVR